MAAESQAQLQAYSSSAMPQTTLELSSWALLLQGEHCSQWHCHQRNASGALDPEILAAAAAGLAPHGWLGWLLRWVATLAAGL